MIQRHVCSPVGCMDCCRAFQEILSLIARLRAPPAPA
jgi:hypothetical protein